VAAKKTWAGPPGGPVFFSAKQPLVAGPQVNFSRQNFNVLFELRIAEVLALPLDLYTYR
jgi:hypothetical protein